LRESHLDVAETHGKEHGRRICRRLQCSTRLAEHSDWPGLRQVCRLTRTTHRNGEEVVEIAYAVSSVPRSQADAATFLRWWREHWTIENRSHWVRDVTMGEDACPIKTGDAPQNLAAFRNALISLLRLQGAENIAAALRETTWKTSHLFTMLGIVKK
jgi:predicted transposase YbfD/YdcC